MDDGAVVDVGDIASCPLGNLLVGEERFGPRENLALLPPPRHNNNLRHGRRSSRPPVHRCYYCCGEYWYRCKRDLNCLMASSLLVVAPAAGAASSSSCDDDVGPFLFCLSPSLVFGFPRRFYAMLCIIAIEIEDR